jgi:hypothetical protein
MEMDAAESPRPSHADDGHTTMAVALDKQVKECAHCVAHSGGPNAPAVSFGVPGNLGRDAANASPQVQRFFFPSLPTPRLLASSRPHGPPFVTAPLHVLISVFLI